MLKPIVGALIGRVLAALFIAICMALGFGPDEWARWLLGTMFDSATLLARLAFIGLAIITFYLLIRQLKSINKLPAAAAISLVPASFSPIPSKLEERIFIS